MRKLCLALVIMGLCLSSQVLAEAPRVKIVVPDTNYQNYSASRIRIAGYTQPGNTVTVNGSEVKVYPTGAFVDRVPIEVGVNEIIIEASNDSGKATAKRTIKRRPGAKAVPDDKLLIERTSIEPEQELELLPGDLIQVAFKGTPGGKGRFSIGDTLIDLPMTETSRSGIAGYYTGVYRVQGGDLWVNQPVKFVLEVENLSETSAESQARISVDSRQWPRVGRLVEENGYLYAGLGQARLGGAQLGNLSQGTLLELTGRVGDMYRVRLSKSRVGWVHSRMIELLPAGTPPPRTLVNAGTLRGNSKSDHFSISLDSRVPYTLEPIMEPPALVLNLYGATSNITWLTHYLSARMIDRVSWDQVEEDHLQIKFDLKEAPVWGYGCGYTSDNGTKLEVTVRSAPERATDITLPLQGLKIALDPGHGASNRGALGSLGTLEKKVNLQIALRMKEQFEKAGAEVILTRDSDKYVDNVERPLKAIEEDADFFFSIHCNSVGLASDPLASSGVSTYYRYVPYQPLSQALYRSLRDIGLDGYGTVGSFNSTVVRFPEVPSVLIEMAFLSHPEDEAKVIDPDFQDRIAGAMVQGFEDYLQNP